jgi:hypothetical protein
MPMHFNSADIGFSHDILQVLIGVLLFPICCYHETRTENPIIPYKFLRNTSILGACLIGESRISLSRGGHPADIVYVQLEKASLISPRFTCNSPVSALCFNINEINYVANPYSAYRRFV